MNTIGANSMSAEYTTNISMSDLDLQSSDERQISRIAESAYYKAEARGFLLGYELDDWLAAEAEAEEQ